MDTNGHQSKQRERRIGSAHGSRAYFGGLAKAVFYFTMKNIKLTEIFESGKQDEDLRHRALTCSAPALARCYPRSFTFYLGDPFPRFLRWYWKRNAPIT